MDLLSEIFSTFQEFNRMANSVTGTVDGAITTTMNIIGAVIIVFGLIQCFFGFKLFKLYLGIVGFLFAFLIGAIAEVLIFEYSFFIVALLFGAIGAWLSFKIYKASIFVCVFLVTTIAPVLIGIVTNSPFLIVAGVILGIVTGAIGMKLVKPVLIFSTAIPGGILVFQGASYLQGIESGVAILIGIGFCTGGILYQFHVNKNKYSEIESMIGPNKDNIWTKYSKEILLVLIINISILIASIIFTSERGFINPISLSILMITIPLSIYIVIRHRRKYEQKNNDITDKNTNLICLCGHKNTKESEFCGECGVKLERNTPVENAVLICSCGLTYEKGDVFCVGCGNKLTTTENH